MHISKTNNFKHSITIFNICKQTAAAAVAK